MDRDLVAFWKSAPGDFLGALFAHSAFLALSFDATGRVLAQSAALSRLTGRSDDAVRGRPLTELMPEGSARLFADVVLPELARHGTIDGVDIELLDAGGEALPVRLSALCEVDDTGGCVRAVAVLSDLRETRAALEALDRKAAEAQEASEAKSRFLAAMSHEIRTPMNAILGFAQLLDMSDLDETRAGHVKAILSAGESLMTLLADLLDLTQVEAGRMRVDLRPFDLHELLDSVAGWWRAAAAQKGLALSVVRAEGLPRHVISDRGRIEQVLHNYLGNAVKFTPAGQVELSVETLGPVEGGEAPETAIRFRVADTGPGIAPSEVARLYRPFVRIEDEGAPAREGWGLGLSICAGIAEAMGAEVGVESEPGRGSVFWFDVPVGVVEMQGEDVAQAGPEEAPGRPGRRILVAEDDRLNQEVMRRILAGMGHDVSVAANGFEALEALEREAFDVVLMDVMMPGLDGVAATRRLRAASHGQSGIPVIACSAHVSPEAEARYREIGMTAFLPKPVDRARLAEAIEAALGGREAEAG
jgi:signal transduction histidine kinase/CheY-like chemotaxis protein